MTYFRQFLILALVPLTAWSGTPHLGCRWSNGEIRLFCPKLLQQAQHRNSTCDNASGRPERKSCCGDGTGGCCSSANGSRQQETGCCADGCHCTPVCLKSDVNPAVKEIVSPQLVEFELAAVDVVQFRLPRVTHVELSALGFNPRVPDDLIVLCERWLI